MGNVIVGQHRAPCVTDETAARPGALEDARQVVHQLVHEHVPRAVHDNAALKAVERVDLRVSHFKMGNELVAIVLGKQNL